MSATMTIDEALAWPGLVVAAWDGWTHRGEQLGVYAVGASGAKLLAHAQVEPERRPEWGAALLARGVRVGITYGSNEFLWVGDAHGFDAWGLEAWALAATRDALRVGDVTVPRGDVRAIVSFLDARDAGHRGVRIDRRVGPPVVIAEEHDPAAVMDPTYDRFNLMIDGAWASFLGRDLARWLALPHEDELP